ncbi:MAG: hypothetical protein WCH34_09905 [Bacteroidota bacterium]
MEIIIPFSKTDFTHDGIHIHTGKFVMELQTEWEELFYNKFKPFYANTLEGHPSAMQRLTVYMDPGDESNFDFGMELIDGEIDIDTNMAIEKYSKASTVYAIGSQFQDDDDSPIFLIKNDSLPEDILVLKYIADDDEDDEKDTIPVNDETRKISI